jgi:hypothetical protein
VLRDVGQRFLRDVEQVLRDLVGNGRRVDVDRIDVDVDQAVDLPLAREVMQR